MNAGGLSGVAGNSAGTSGAPSGSAGTLASAGGAASSASVAGSSGNGGSAGSGGAAGTTGGGAAGSGGTGGAAGGGDFALSSPDLAEGSMIAAKYTCAAAGFEGGLLPELVWTAGPEGTKSYAITFIDVDLAEAAADLGYHWVIYNIPASTLGLPEDFKNAASIGASQNREYLGPCPNFGGGSATHTYEFTLYALASETLTLTPITGIGAVKDAQAKLEASHLASAVLSGTSNASPP